MTTLRLPNRESRWVWEIDQDRSRILIEVVKVEFNGEEWWVTTRTLPEAPSPMFAPLLDPQEHLNDLDRFWEAVTPVGGRVEDLSHPISREQYKRTRNSSQEKLC